MCHKTNRKHKVWLLALLVLAIWRNPNTEAATISVTNTADSGLGSLRAALVRAQNGDTVDATGVSGTILLTSGQLLVDRSVTILGPGPDNLAVSGNAASRVFYVGIGIINISGLTITNGYVAGTSFLADSGGGILNDNATLTLSNCIVSGNSAYCGGGIFTFNNLGSGAAPVTIINSTVSSNSAQSDGGGIYSDGESSSVTLTVTNSTISDNIAQYGGGIYNDGESGSATLTIANSTLSANTAVIPDGLGLGGGIINDGTSEGNAMMTIANCILTNCSAVYGGGIYNDSDTGVATLTITNSTISGNSVVLGGGGIFNNGESGGAMVTIARSTISGNTAYAGPGYGGGIYNDCVKGSNAVITVADSTVSGNVAIYNGGGIFNDGAGTLSISGTAISGNISQDAGGGGIEADGGTLSVANSTVSGNYGAYLGGGIGSDSGTLSIVNSTICSNFADSGGGIGIQGATLEIGSTVLKAFSSSDNIASSGTVTSLGYNLSSDDGGGFLTATGDQLNTDPLLGPLTNNGGPTFTHTLLAGSPAINQGKNFSGAMYDQRGPGFVRTYDDPAAPIAPGGDGTDIGAFEVQPPACSTVVTTTADSGPGSLRAALACASQGDTVDATGISGTILLTTGELLVNQNVAISGPGPANLAVNGGAASRVFHIEPGAVVIISGLTITNGNAAGTNFPADGGGGIYNDHATLTVSNCAVSGNSADSTGGGILNDVGAMLTTVNSTLSGNSSVFGGGGIDNSGTLTMVKSTAGGNSTGGNGGGILNEAGATAFVSNSIVDANSSVSGGGGLANSGTLTVNYSTVSANSANLGGGFYNDVKATVTVTNSTVSGNSAVGGGGIENNWSANIVNSTISGNSATSNGGGFGNFKTLWSFNCTVSGNSSPIGGGIYNGNGGIVLMGNDLLNAGALGANIANSGNVISLGYNLSSDNAGGLLTAIADQINSDPKLGPLTNNGGPTFTHALLLGSPAIDQGANSDAFGPLPIYDQRGPGFVRTSRNFASPLPPGGDGTDIGAFEVQVPPCSPVVTTTADDGLGSLRIVLECASAGATIDATGISGTILLTNGELLVTNNINILGPGPGNLVINGNAASRVFHVGSNAVVTISGLTITNGNAAGTNFPADAGGGIYNDHSTLTVSNCVVSGNFASFRGGGILNDGDTMLSGGEPANATMTVVNSIINGNSASSGGGGIFNDADGIVNDGGDPANATLVIIDSTLDGNSATSGGGVLNESLYYGSAMLTVLGSTISSNLATDGAGILSGSYVFSSATLMISNSTISGNSATNGSGGGIANGGTLAILNSSIISNSAVSGGGGGIFNYNESLQIGSTIIQAGAACGTISSPVYIPSNLAPSLGYNLSSDSGGGLLTATGDQINTDPMLGPLQNNGGPTFTHALLCGSPAIDAGKNFSGARYDQRGPGFARTFDDPFTPNVPGGDGTDIGAFEVQTSCHLPPVALCTNLTVMANSNCVAFASINNGSYTADANDTITVAQVPPGPYPLGTNSVTLVVTDSQGASNWCTATVVVVDKTPPSITCPPDITTAMDGDSCETMLNVGTASATDNCGTVTVNAARSDGKALSDPYPVGTTTVTWTAIDNAGNSASCVQQVTVLNAKSITRRFNRIPIARNQYLWFTAVVSPVWTLPSNTNVTVNFIDASIRFSAGGSNYDLVVPNGSVTFSASVSNNATTAFNRTECVTTAPRNLRGHVLLTALEYQLPAALPGGIEDVTLSGTFLSSVPGLHLDLEWSAAVYTRFTNQSALGVKPTDERTAEYPNLDRAGTPEAFKPYVTGGATGDGGENYTGSLSAALRVSPCFEVQPVATAELRILSIQFQHNDAYITWTAAGGSQALLQEGTSLTQFVDIPGSLIVVPDSGVVTNTYVIIGGATNMPARFYRARLAP